MIAPAVASAGDDTCLLQIGDNALNGAFGNPNLDSHIAQAKQRITRQTNQDMRMVCKKCPGYRAFGSLLRH